MLGFQGRKLNLCHVIPLEPCFSFLPAVCCRQSLLTGLSPCSCPSPSIYAPLLHLFSNCSSKYLIPLLEDSQWIPIACCSAYSFSLNSWAFIIWLNWITQVYSLLPSHIQLHTLHSNPSMLFIVPRLPSRPFGLLFSSTGTYSFLPAFQFK